MKLNKQKSIENEKSKYKTPHGTWKIANF